MAKQFTNGSGFEYCCAKALLQAYAQRHVPLLIDQRSIPGFMLRQSQFKNVDLDVQQQQLKAANAVAKQIVTSTEKWARGICNSNDRYWLRVGDQARNMDVRDLVIYSERGYTLGISLKWNSVEIKSLRLGDNWFRQFKIPDNGEWADQAGPHNKRLSAYSTWKDAKADLGDDGVYEPYRNAFIDEIHLGIDQPGFIERFAQFLFGKQSYLKVMAEKKGCELTMAYYDNGKLPTRIIEAAPSDRGKNYFNVVFDRGWSLLFRIHNKDTEIKPHVGLGMSLTVTVAGWGEKSGMRCWAVND